MSDITGEFRAERAIRREDGEVRRGVAWEVYDEARRLALDGRLLLVRCTDAHYQLSPLDAGRTWLINLYPGNQRIMGDRNRPKSPFLRTPSDRCWTLVDIINAAVAARERP